MTNKIAISLLGCGLLVATLQAALSPHPTALTVKYKDKLLPVVKVTGSDPHVMVDGQIHMVRSEPLYLLQPAARFADNYVESLDSALGGSVKLTFVGGGSGAGYSRSYFEASLKAKKTLQGGFAVVMVYSASDPFSQEIPKHFKANDFTTMTVHEIPDLPAGETVKVKFSSTGRNLSFDPVYFTQIFDGTGREVMTNGVEHAWQYFAMRDLFQLSLARKKYLERFKGADHDAVPFMMPKPAFGDGVVLPSAEVTAVLTISESGQVTAVETQGVEVAETNHVILSTLEGWLFLPKLKAGQPVPVKIAIPLKF